MRQRQQVFVVVVFSLLMKRRWNGILDHLPVNREGSHPDETKIYSYHK